MRDMPPECLMTTVLPSKAEMLHPVKTWPDFVRRMLAEPAAGEGLGMAAFVEGGGLGATGASAIGRADQA